MARCTAIESSKTSAEVIRQSTRESDLSARSGGDRFTILLSDTGIAAVEAVIKRIEERIADKFQGEVTVCIGCIPSKDGQGAAELVGEARKVLSSAKLQGRGRHAFAGSPNPVVDEGRHTILVVDDEPSNVKLFDAMLRPLKYDVIKATNGQEALRAVGTVDVDLILLDAMMPYMDGFEACRRLKQSPATRMIPVIMVTALDDRESKVRAIEAGADDFITKPADRVELTARIRALVRTKRLNDSLVSIENVLFSLANAVEAKNAYTQGHTKRVSNLAAHLGRLMELPTRDLEALRIGGILHDIGKIGIPDSLLNKPGRLNPEEWQLMKAHPAMGHNMAEPLRPILKGALEVIRHHHERLDGSGYPDGIKGDEISMVARIMAVADVYDALITDRPYRKGMPREEALILIEGEADEGRLDKTVVGHLVSLVSSLTELSSKVRS